MIATSFYERELSPSHGDIRLCLIFSITLHFLLVASLLAYSQRTQVTPKNISESLSVSILLNANSTSLRSKNLQPQKIEEQKSYFSPINDDQQKQPHSKSNTSNNRSKDIETQSKNNTRQKYASIDLDKTKNEIAQLVETINKPEHRIRSILNQNGSSLAEEKYLKAWRKKCEEIGRRNYPRDRLEGQVTTEIVIASDGSLVKAIIIKSSGIPSIDEAVIKTIQQASPFPPFNTEMRKKYDMIEFIRLWKFSNSQPIIY